MIRGGDSDLFSTAIVSYWLRLRRQYAASANALHAPLCIENNPKSITSLRKLQSNVVILCEIHKMAVDMLDNMIKVIYTLLH
jgi:hypothetical protein